MYGKWTRYTDKGTLCFQFVLFGLHGCVQFLEDQFHIRSPGEYDYHCSLLDGPFAAEDSVTYGINYRSPLNNIEYFHVSCGQLPQDIMHTLFEGVIPKEIRLMLHRFIFIDHLFTMERFNQRVSSFAYGRSEFSTKPPKEFDVRCLKGDTKLPLSGAYNI